MKSQNYVLNVQIIDNKEMCTCYYYIRHIVIEHNITDCFSCCYVHVDLLLFVAWGVWICLRAVVKFFNLKSLKCSFHIFSFYCLNSVRINTKKGTGHKTIVTAVNL